MKQINLEELILSKNYKYSELTKEDIILIKDYIRFDLDDIKELIKEACFQVLDIAVEQAEGYYYDKSGEECNAHVSEFSISKIKDWIV